MKTIKLVLISILSLLTFAACETEPIEADLINEQTTDLTSKNVDKGKEVFKSKLQNRVLNSDALKDNFVDNSFTRKLQIYTPPGYKKNGTQQYPVVYLLHGEPFSEKAFIDEDLFQEWIDQSPLWTQYVAANSDLPETDFKALLQGTRARPNTTMS